MKKMVILIVGVIFFGAPFHVVAQEFDNAKDDYVIEPGELTGPDSDRPMPTQQEIEQDQQESGYANAPETITEEKTSPACFDYYTFQSVQVSLGTQKDYFEPGELVTMTGEVINENDYPIVDGNVFVRVSRRNGNYLDEGNFVIDEFFAIEHMEISANGTAELSFDWMIPEGASATEYVFDYFFSVGKRFNLGGLPFSNEVIIGNSTFRVISQNQDFLSFDRSGTKVNGKKYAHIGNWPEILPGQEVVITQPLTNTFDESQEVDVTYDLYFWDSLHPDDLVSSTKDVVTIPANGSMDLTYTIPEMNDSVYYLKITATSGDHSSIVNVRMSSNQGHARLNFPAIDQFPVKKGEDFTLFSCYHSASNVPAEGKVLVTLLDENNDQIAHAQHDGMIMSEMSVITQNIKAEKDHDYFTLIAEIYDEKGSLVEKYETVYDCASFGLCATSPVKMGTVFSVKNIMFMIFILIPVAVVGYLLIARKKRS
jgi:hypothetical protein